MNPVRGGGLIFFLGGYPSAAILQVDRPRRALGWLRSSESPHWRHFLPLAVGRPHHPAERIDVEGLPALVNEANVAIV